MGVELTSKSSLERKPAINPPQARNGELLSEVEKPAKQIDSLDTSPKNSRLNAEIDLPSDWKIEDSEVLYHIAGWGDPYFSINAAGHVTVSPKGVRGGSR